MSSAENASSNTLVNAPCPHFSSSREILSAFEDVSTVTLPAAIINFSTSAAGHVFEGSPISPAERQASSKTRTRPCWASFSISLLNSVAGIAEALRRAVVQKYRLDLGIETALLRVEKGACHVLRIPMSKVQRQVPCLVAIVADADGQHVQPGAGRLR